MSQFCLFELPVPFYFLFSLWLRHENKFLLSCSGWTLDHQWVLFPKFPAREKKCTYFGSWSFSLSPFLFLLFFLHFAKEVDATTPTKTPSISRDRRAKLQGSQNLSPSAIHRTKLFYLKFRTFTYVSGTTETVHKRIFPSRVVREQMPDCPARGLPAV